MPEEEELNLYGAPKADPHDQYRHFSGQTRVIPLLTLEPKEEAMRIDDTLGIELANQLLIDIDQSGVRPESGTGSGPYAE